MIDVEREVREFVSASFEAVPETTASEIVAGARPAGSARRRRGPVLVAALVVVALVAATIVGVVSLDGGRDATTRVGSSQREPVVETDTDPTPSTPGEWTIDLGGEIPYPPVIVDGAVVIVSANDDFTQTQVLALEVETASRRWSEDLGSPVVSVPVVAGDRVLLRLADDRLVALDAADGSQQWSARTGVNVKGPPPPVVAGDTVYVGSQDGVVRALGLDDGREIWSRRLAEAVHATPAYTDDALYVSTGSLPFGPESIGGVYALDARSGAVTWHTRTDAPVVTTPALGGGSVAVTTTDFGKRSRSQLVRVWTPDGASTSVPLDGAASAPVFGARGAWVVSTSNGVIEPRDRLALRADPRWTVSVGTDQQQPTLTRAGGWLVGAGSDVVAVDGRSGTEVWRTRFPDAFFADSDELGRIVVISRRGSLAVIDASDGSVLVGYSLHDTPIGAVLDDGTLVWTGTGGLVTAARVP